MPGLTMAATVHKGVTTMTTVTVNGALYRVIDQRSTSSSGTKFYGRFVFTLVSVSDGTRWTAYGKRVSHNSRLTALRDA